MSDAPSTRRQIGGLAPASALSRMRGDAQPPSAPTSATPSTPAAPAPAEPAAAPPADAPEVPSPEPAPSAPESAAATRTRRSTAPKASTVKKSPQNGAQRPTAASAAEKMTTYIAHDVRERAKAAFRATGGAEGDESFSAFVERALLREVERRERAHNGGQRFVSDGRRLTAGRPLR